MNSEPSFWNAGTVTKTRMAAAVMTSHFRRSDQATGFVIGSENG